MRIHSNGRVGIGTTTPADQLSILSPVGMENKVLSLQSGIGTRWCLGVGDIDGKYFTIQEAGVSPPHLVIEKTSGNVGIGVIPPQLSQYKLEVAGKVRACEISVELSSWCDYVFDKDYKRPTPKEKDVYYKTYGHLMYLPSAAEIEENGLDVGGTIKGVAQNTEENSLDLVNHDVRIENLESDIAEKDREIEKLKTENEMFKEKQNQIELRLKKLEAKK